MAPRYPPAAISTAANDGTHACLLCRAAQLAARATDPITVIRGNTRVRPMKGSRPRESLSCPIHAYANQ